MVFLSSERALAVSFYSTDYVLEQRCKQGSRSLDAMSRLDSSDRCRALSNSLEASRSAVELAAPSNPLGPVGISSMSLLEGFQTGWVAFW